LIDFLELKNILLINREKPLTEIILYSI